MCYDDPRTEFDDVMWCFTAFALELGVHGLREATRVAGVQYGAYGPSRS